jgi:hypothetical protein
MHKKCVPEQKKVVKVFETKAAILFCQATFPANFWRNLPARVA